MGSPRRRPLIVVAVAALVVSACGGDDTIDPVATGDTVAPAASSTSTSAPSLDPDDIVVPGDQSGVVDECAADDAGTDAADTFDQAGLALDPVDQRRFVPLDDPEMVAAAEATWLGPDDVVMGILHAGEAQAFPISQMTYHHVANTTVAGEPYLVTY